MALGTTGVGGAEPEILMLVNPMPGVIEGHDGKKVITELMAIGQGRAALIPLMLAAPR